MSNAVDRPVCPCSSRKWKRWLVSSGRAEAGEHAHRPQLAAVHRLVDAARERELAGVADLLVRAHVVGPVDVLERDAAHRRVLSFPAFPSGSWAPYIISVRVRPRHLRFGRDPHRLRRRHRRRAQPHARYDATATARWRRWVGVGRDELCCERAGVPADELDEVAATLPRRLRRVAGASTRARTCASTRRCAPSAATKRSRPTSRASSPARSSSKLGLGDEFIAVLGEDDVGAREARSAHRRHHARQGRRRARADALRRRLARRRRDGATPPASISASSPTATPHPRRFARRPPSITSIASTS